jgi:hypothetical protein
MASVDEVLQLIDSRDVFFAIEAMARDADVAGAAKLFHDCMKTLYWKRRDLSRCIVIGLAGVTFAMTRAIDADAKNEAELAYKLRSAAKAMCYDIASFTWNGWDEPGIAIGKAELAIGLDAAKANLRLAHELNKGDLPLSRAYWMLAGHQLSAGDRDAARLSYLEGEKHADAAESRPDALLARAFATLVDVLARPGDSGRRSQMDATLVELGGERDGQAFVRQVHAAERVFRAAC